VVEVDWVATGCAETFGEDFCAVGPAFPGLAFGASRVDNNYCGFVVPNLDAPAGAGVVEDGDVVVTAGVADLPDPGLVVSEGFEDLVDALDGLPPLGIFNWAGGCKTPCFGDLVIKARDRG
jgi:hypothetical protein